MSEVVRELADELEKYASSRANFHELSDSERYQVARQLVIARSQASNADGHNDKLWECGAYRTILERKKNYYMYLCGQVGVDHDEARHMWWNCVYDDVAPVNRSKVV